MHWLRSRSAAVHRRPLAHLVLRDRPRAQHPRRIMGADGVASSPAGRVGCDAARGGQPLSLPPVPRGGGATRSVSGLYQLEPIRANGREATPKGEVALNSSSARNQSWRAPAGTRCQTHVNVWRALIASPFWVLMVIDVARKSPAARLDRGNPSRRTRGIGIDPQHHDADDVRRGDHAGPGARSPWQNRAHRQAFTRRAHAARRDGAPGHMIPEGTRFW